LNQSLLSELIQKFTPQSKLLREWKLQGGLSAHITAFEIEHADGCTQKLILRQHSKAASPDLASNEFRLLQLLQKAGLAVQTPYYRAEAGPLCATSTIILEFVEGEPLFDCHTLLDDCSNYTSQMATYLTQVHGISSAQHDLSFLPNKIDAPLPAHWHGPSAARIRSLLEPIWPLTHANQPTLVHGDFWPGNLLWREGQLVAVIDWEDAAIGDPLQDLAIARFDILFIFGVEAMDQFTRYYQAQSPQVDFTQLPYWDLYAALRASDGIVEWAPGWPGLGRSDITEDTIRAAHEWFIEHR